MVTRSVEQQLRRFLVTLLALCTPGIAISQTLQIGNGGTGATTAAGALSNLGAAPAASGVPSGMIMFIDTGTCPSGWTEDDVLANYNVLVTTTAAGDVGTHAAQSLTAAAQTVNSLTAAAQTFTGSTTTVPAETVNSLTAAAQTFTGTSDTTSAVSAGTPAGVNSGGSFAEGAISWPTPVPTIAAGTFTQPTIAWPTAPTNVPTNSTTSWTIATGGYASSTTHFSPDSFGGVALTSSSTSITIPAATISWPTKVPTASSGAFTEGAISWPTGSSSVPTIASGTFTQPTFAGSALGTHTHTVTPTGTNGTSAVTGTLNSTTITPLGSNTSSAVTGTMNSSAVTGNTAYYKVIACKKN